VAEASAGLYATLHLALDRYPATAASTTPLNFLQTGCPSCHPTNSVKALKASHHEVSTPLLTFLHKYQCFYQKVKVKTF